MKTRNLLFFCVLVTLPVSLWAFSIAKSPTGKIVHWPSNVRTIPYYVNANAPGVSSSTALNVVRESFNDWQNVSCSYLGFQYMGSTYVTNRVIPMGGGADGKNELTWIRDSSWQFGQYVLGVTSPLYQWDGLIYEADIAFNGYYYDWNNSRDLSYGQMDLKSVIIHEQGHFFGLQHVLDYQNYPDYPTMAPAVEPNGGSATLSQDDKLAICFLYPVNGTYTCSNDRQCPFVVDTDRNTGKEYYAERYTCNNGRCSRNNLQFGDMCENSSQCSGGLSCSFISEGTAGKLYICTRSCNYQNDDCPANYHCDQSKSLCVPGQKRKNNGVKCSTSSECKSGYCFKDPDHVKRCRIKCYTSNDKCPAGTSCWAPNSFTSIGGCIPDAEKPKKQFGFKCSNGAECKSGYCFGLPGNSPVCTQRCTPNTANSCPYNYTCVKNGSIYVCAFQPTLNKKNGESCKMDSDCASRFCFAAPWDRSEPKVCRSRCMLSDWKCVPGTACVAYGNPNNGVCLPNAGKAGTGQACTKNQDCAGDLCWDAGANSYCTSVCVNGKCPDGYTCVYNRTSMINVCIKNNPSANPDGGYGGGGGCHAGSSGARDWWLPILGLTMLIIRRRKSNSPH